MLLDPLERMKKVDARMNLTQGVLEGVGCTLVFSHFFFFCNCEELLIVVSKRIGCE